jgi:transposase
MNLSVDQADVYQGYRAVVTTMTAEYGVGLTIIHNTAVNSNDFIDFLQALRRHFPNRLLALFMDNLTVHRSLTVKPYYEQLNIMPVWNVSYSPEFAPIGKCPLLPLLTTTEL